MQVELKGKCRSVTCVQMSHRADGIEARERAVGRWHGGSPAGAAVIAAGVTLLLGLCGSSRAADATDNASAGSDTLEAVTVTARRREESIQDVPIAISAFDKNFLDRQAFNDITQLTSYTPSLQMPISTGGSGGGIFLRGIGSISYSAVMDQAVALNFDGVQVSTGLPLRTSTLDMEQVEVLKGPQALFFGKNSPGGVISFRSADPTDHPEAMLRAGYETADMQKYFDGMVSGPIVDGLQGRLAIHYLDQDGWLKVRSETLTAAQSGAYVDAPTYSLPYNRYPEGHEIDTRGTLKYDAGPLQIIAKATFSTVIGSGSAGQIEQLINCPTGTPRYWYAPLPASLNIGNCTPDNITSGGAIPPIVLQHDPALYGSAPGGERSDQQLIGSLDAKYKLDDLGLVIESVSGWYSVWDDGAPGPYAPTAITNVASGEPVHLGQGSEELRLTSEWSTPVNLVAGAFYDRSTNYSENDPAILVPEGGGWIFPGKENYRIGQHSVSGFGQVTWKITPQWDLSGGVRETHEVKTADEIDFNNKPVPVVNNQLSFSNTSPEATLSYKPVNDLMFYVSYKQGFKAGGFDTGYGRATQLASDPSADFSFKPERITGVEAGMKSTWLNDTLQLDLAGYGYRYSNMQLVSIVPPFSFFTVNAAGSDIDGAEAQLTWKPPVAGLTIRSNAAYNYTKYTRFLAECYGGQTIAAGCNQAYDPATAAYTSQSLAGRTLAYAPRFSATLNVNYDVRLGNVASLGDLMLGFSSDTSFSSNYYTDIPDEPGSLQSAFAKADLSMRLGRTDHFWEVAVICRNLTNKYTVEESHDSSFSALGTGTNAGVLADTDGVVSMGRTFLVQLTVHPF